MSDSPTKAKDYKPTEKEKLELEAKNLRKAEKKARVEKYLEE
jgi:hypothetical protein